MPNQKDLFFVVCTPLSEDEFWAKSQTAQFIHDNGLAIYVNSRYSIHFENKKGLGSVYNNYLNEDYKDKIVVFLHDDIVLGYAYQTLKRILNEAHQRFDVVGLAGATRIQLTYPTLWHLMQKGMSGSVGHEINGLSQMTNFGMSPQKCIVVDGLFISVNTEKIVSINHTFDEQFKFHHYDLDFCIQANEKGLTVGTWPIWVTHMSPGLTSLEKADWVGSNELFCKKYHIK